MIKTGIVGATGYSGVELMRLLSAHPHADLVLVTSRTEKGRNVSEMFPSLRGVIDLVYTDPDINELSSCDVVFFATPNGTAMQHVPALLESDTRVIDLSADFRLRDHNVWEKWYGLKHNCKHLLEEAVYGLPEINRAQIKASRLVANPGCYPTAIQLGFIPLLEKNLVDPRTLIADAKSGISGAGRKTSIPHLFCETSESLSAYGVDGHRHLPEIKQGLNSASSEDVELVFVPHLVPMIRGIYATLYARLGDRSIDIQKIFEDRYINEPFVDIMPEGSHPDTRSVRGTNLCRLAPHIPQDGDTVVILAVEDNLVKGAAGQAIQNMNIMFDIAEETGLTYSACFP
jgi:N-acetyl-gamma-glutamyl-phosphate reductase